MILARDIFQIKFGYMDQVLPVIKAALESNPQITGASRILTDISGPHFTLIVETKAESVDAYWNAMQASFAQMDRAEEGSQIRQYMESGRREFYTIEYEAG